MKPSTIAVIIILGVVYLALRIADRARLKHDQKGEPQTFVIPHEIDGKPIGELTEEIVDEFQDATKIVIPDTVTSLGENVFAYFSLTSVEIPNSVTSIGESAFEGCDNLTSVEIPDSVTSIGEGAFEDCKSLTSVEIPASVKLGKDVFPVSCRVVRK